jgi:uncharacterized membrane protein
MGYAVGTPTQLLNSNLKVSDVLNATASVLHDQGSTLAEAEVNHIAIASISSLETVKLGKLLYLSQPGSDSALDTTINVFQLVNGSAQLNNGASFLTVPGLTATVPGVSSFGVALRVIQPAQMARGPVGVQASTSQVVVRVTLNLLPILGNAVTATVDYTMGSGNGTLTAIQCGTSPGITINAQTSGATIGNSLTVALLGSLPISGTVAPATPTSVSFSYPTQFAPPVGPTPSFSRHVGVANVGLSPSAFSVGAGSGLLGIVGGLAEPIVSTALQTLDVALVPSLGPVLKALGLDVAGADVTALGIFPTPPACGGASLVK